MLPSSKTSTGLTLNAGSSLIHYSFPTTDNHVMLWQCRLRTSQHYISWKKMFLIQKYLLACFNVKFVNTQNNPETHLLNNHIKNVSSLYFIVTCMDHLVPIISIDLISFSFTDYHWLFLLKKFEKLVSIKKI